MTYFVLIKHGHMFCVLQYINAVYVVVLGGHESVRKILRVGDLSAMLNHRKEWPTHDPQNRPTHDLYHIAKQG